MIAVMLIYANDDSHVTIIIIHDFNGIYNCRQCLPGLHEMATKFQCDVLEYNYQIGIHSIVTIITIIIIILYQYDLSLSLHGL